jgi:ferredoxin, 2Fe-2S
MVSQPHAFMSIKFKISDFDENVYECEGEEGDELM